MTEPESATAAEAASQPAQVTPARRLGRALVALLLVGGIVSLAWWLPVGPWVVRLVERVRAAGTPGVAIFAGFYVVAGLVFVPVGVLRVAAGFLYGLGWGALLVFPLDALSGFIGFTLARTVLRGPVQRRLRGHPKLAALEAAADAGGFGLVALLRLTPALPFSGINYALGVTRIPARTYVLASVVGLIPITFAFLQLGALLPGVTSLASARLLAQSWVMWATVASTVVVVVVMLVLGKRALSSAQAARDGAAAPARDRPPAPR
ncbi:MAG: TVP38/TMEM64 family protein [Deltaproteobacteria bacterium]|nr:TVP38/TMEM64 family protein [Deltaproteobacteria bacterium]